MVVRSLSASLELQINGEDAVLYPLQLSILNPFRFDKLLSRAVPRNCCRCSSPLQLRKQFDDATVLVSDVPLRLHPRAPEGVVCALNARRACDT
jgi:hypothetical protein